MPLSYGKGFGHQAEDKDNSSESDHRPKRRKFDYNMKSTTPKDSRASSVPMKSKFGAKMLAKMGYVEGQGLGAAGRGRLAPIETQLRPQGIGLGAVKEKTAQAKAEEKREAAFRGTVLEDSEEEETQRRAKSKKDRLSARMGNTASSVKRKVKYRTAAEIEADVKGLQVPDALKSIIDATGSEMKLLTSTAGLMTSVNGMVASETDGEKIAKRARREVEAFAEEWKSLAERNNYFDMQQAQLAQEIVDNELEITRLQKMIDCVQTIQELSTETLSADDAWEATISQLELLDTDTFLDGDSGATGNDVQLQELVVATIQPLFQSAMQSWEPLREPSQVFHHLDRVKHLLQIEVISNGTEITTYRNSAGLPRTKKFTTPYESLISTLWLPPVRSAIINEWDPCDPSALIDLVNMWRPILPPFIVSSLLSRFIPQRLAKALGEWQPNGSSKRKSRPHAALTSPHTYLFPWFPHLPSYHASPTSSAGLVAEFKRKLKLLLSSWSIASAGVIPHLANWQPILQGELPSLLTRHLVPRLASHLTDKFLVDPSDQDLSPLNQVLQWSSYLPSTTMAHLLVAELFPKWHQTLHVWLTSDPNYEEIREWFLWWKDQLPANINAVPVIDAEWNKGLEIIALALDLGPEAVATKLPLPSSGPAHSAPNDATGREALEKPAPQQTHAAVSTFRDVVEDWCALHDLMIIPMREADPASGMPLFRITASANGRGGAVVYLKGDVIWAREGTGESRAFIPVELNEALQKRAEGR